MKKVILIDLNLYSVPADFTDRCRKNWDGLTIRAPKNREAEITETNFCIGSMWITVGNLVFTQFLLSNNSVL